MSTDKTPLTKIIFEGDFCDSCEDGLIKFLEPIPPREAT